MKANGLHLTTQYTTSLQSLAVQNLQHCHSGLWSLCSAQAVQQDYPGHEEGLEESGDILRENLSLDKQRCITSIKCVRQRPIPPGHLAHFPSHRFFSSTLWGWKDKSVPRKSRIKHMLTARQTVSIKCEKSNKVLFISRCYWIKQFTTSAPTAMAINTDYQRR